METADIIVQADIVEYVGQFCEMTYRNGEYWGLSPFKEERTPSFSINAEKQRFYDFSSGKGGNIIQFIKEYYKCSVAEAVEKLKQYLNIGNDGTYARTPLTAKVARRYKPMAKKKEQSTSPTVLPDTYMELYENDKQKLEIWRKEGITDAAMEKYQVRYDPFSNRIVYPVRDPCGKIVNVSGRTLDEHYKEKGIRKYTYFQKWGVMNVLYGYFENKEAIDKRGEIILFEGAKSVMKADGWGFPNCGALLTSHISDYQFEFLLRLGKRVVLALDNDVDVFSDRVVKRLAHYIPVQVVDGKKFLGEKDAPVDKGEEIWRRLYEERRDFLSVPFTFTQ